MLAATAVAMTRVRDLPDYLVSDNTVAKVGRKELKINEIMEAMPANVKGDDSVSFVSCMLTSGWCASSRSRRPTISSRVGGGSDRMDEEYRHSLLMRKVDSTMSEQQMRPRLHG